MNSISEILLPKFNQTYMPANNKQDLRTCYAFVVFKEEETFNHFISKFEMFQTKLSNTMSVERLMCASILTCELRLQGEYNRETFVRLFLDCYAQTFQKDLMIKLPDIESTISSHEDFIIQTIMIDSKKKLYEEVNQ